MGDAAAARWSYPVQGGYKERDHAPVDVVHNGDVYRSNWKDAEYNLLGTIPSVHTGDDIIGMEFNIYGREVLSIADGVVTFCRDAVGSTWRQMLVIQHTLADGQHIYSRYAHLKDRLVKLGDVVQVGQAIGHIGDAEGRLAPHLHFDICVTDLLLRDPINWPSTGRSDPQAKTIIDANYVDPLEYIKARLAEAGATHMPIVSAKVTRGDRLSGWVRVPQPGDTPIATYPPDTVLQVNTDAPVIGPDGATYYPVPTTIYVEANCLDLGNGQPPAPVTADKYVLADALVGRVFPAHSAAPSGNKYLFRKKVSIIPASVTPFTDSSGSYEYVKVAGSNDWIASKINSDEELSDTLPN